MAFEYGTYETSLEANISTALACKQFIQAHMQNDARLHEKIDNTKYANVINLLLNAVQQDMLLSATKIWDKGRDTISIPNLLGGYNWDLLRKKPNKIQERRDQLNTQVADYLGSDSLKSLFVARAEGFSHNVDSSFERKKMEVPRPATLEDIYCAIDKAIEYWNEFQLLTNNSVTNYLKLREGFLPIANEFFESIPDINGN